MSSSSHTIFMTGATGFLGNFLLRDLLQRNRRVVAMLREPLAESRNRLSDNLKNLGLDLEECENAGLLTLVPGSLPDGLPSPDSVSECFAGQSVEILSCAASLQLYSNGNSEPFRTNVEGMAKMLEWADSLGISRFHAVSTAYVCGSHTADVREVFHLPKPEFKTEYEHSKWMAEELLTNWSQKNGNQVTIYRPSFLTGESSTGYTTQYSGFYQLARVVHILSEEFADSTNGSKGYIPLRIPGQPDDPQNFVPVDFAARIIAEVICDETLHQNIYHLTDPDPVTNDQIKRHMEEYFQIHGGYFSDGEKTIANCNPAESLLWEQFEALTPRVTHNPRFRPDNTLRVMKDKGVTFPEMTSERFRTMVDFAIENGWGKKSNGRQR